MIGSDADGIASDLVAPPAHILRSIHPLVFAESDGVRKPGKGRGSGKASRSSGAQGLEGSSYQFALMLCIVAWLLQLNGRTREAEDLEKEFSLVSGSSLKAPPRKDCSVDDASRISIGNRIRAVVQSLGMEVDFATSQGIASGCGRTVCMLLDGLAQKTITLLQIRAKKPVHPPNPDFSPDGYQEILEDLELPEEQLVCLGASAHDEEPSSHSRLRSSPSMLRSAEGDASRCMIESGVDPAAWQAEAERLAGQLSRISVKAETSGRFGAWEARLIKARKATETFLSAGPEVQAGVSEWRKELNKHLDALENREAHINREWSNHTLEYSAARQRMADVIQRRDRAEEVVSESTSHLAHLTEQLQQIQEAIDERQSNFDGARPMARMKEAMAVLKREIADMGQKVEIARGHLLLKQKRIAEEMRGVRTS